MLFSFRIVVPNFSQLFDNVDVVSSLGGAFGFNPLERAQEVYCGYYSAITLGDGGCATVCGV